MICGKHQLCRYWTIGLDRLPDLHFDVEAVYVGVATIVVNYRNQQGRLVNEVLIFDGDLISEGHGTYLHPES
ncbi:hypothetical protein I553_6179 [Mycobacterium xenopi 4042]|uniref:Uncharacterized protein n=2 Tax=Mycobacterium xenopi TaxID=1789 RepID=A0AAD1H032_MYCXE|nr:hypothetical protein I552_6626 [Mycobacterium xenopi 3993]EUA42319.1 hypothetical protein I553_6179 [Mycobacterium xenopi 4042]BBU22618.1 hypothetical protein MYXE_24080 [Mycobacterium xenopi]